MSNKQNDNFYTKAPKPTDAKAYVGDVALMEFATKEAIPTAYRFIGMIVQESLSGVIKTYRLEGGVADINYVEQVTDSTGLEELTESGQTGWRIIGRTAANYGDIGVNAIDLSRSSGASATKGATGADSYAEGLNTIASGIGAHSEGSASDASGDYSHAEGVSSTASGDGAHAEGTLGVASGNYSHVEGSTNQAAGLHAHAQGYLVRATGNQSHIGGKAYDATNYHEALGLATFVHQETVAGSGVKQAIAANSAILGGTNNDTTATGLRSVVLGGTAQSAVQPDMVYVPGLKLVSYTTAQIGALTNVELGTILYDSTLNKFVQCTVVSPPTWVDFSGSGTVTSVAVSGTDGIEVDSGSPITGAGTIQLGLHKVNTLAFLNVQDGADVTDASSVAAAGAVMDTGAQAVAGVKTFGSFPITPSSLPSTSYQVANKIYVDTAVASNIQSATIELNAAAVNGLGTAYDLLAAPGVGYYYKILGIMVKIDVTTVLDVGSQTLGFGVAGQQIGSLSNAAVETATTATFQVVLDAGGSSEVIVADNSAFQTILSTPANPISGSVVIKISLSYTIETL